MQSLVDKIKSKEGLRLGNRADVKVIIDCKKKLEAEGLAIFPDEYSSFIKYINGITSDTFSIFGVAPNVDMGFLDIVYENKKIDFIDKSKVIVLGYSVFDWLVYDAMLEQYQTMDLYDGTIVESFSSLNSALGYCLSL